MNLHRYNKSELQELKQNANFTEDEEMIYDMLTKGKSIVQIADKVHLSTRTVDRRIKEIKRKLNL